MYLKRIEALGFKSFADRVELEFGPGITAIVGPNGSGKSNVADAIRWVLGEQSARNLRGNRMEDVIFSGSEKRRPVSMAEVTLTLDNGDGTLPVAYNDVTITRRVFRDGEGEYLLNRVPCRLKDIHDLLEGTGLGKENFSIIGQGKIDEILNARPEERRLVLEEASGVSRYKNRKREALKKVEEAQTGLVRLSDLLSELEGQAGPLEERARQAELFLEYDASLREKRIDLHQGELQEVVQGLVRLGEMREVSRQRLQELEGSLTLDEGRLEETRAGVRTLEEEMRLWQERGLEAATEGQRLQGELAVIQEKLSAADGDEEKIREQLSRDGEARALLEAEAEGVSGRLASLTVDREDQEKDLTQVEQDLALAASGLAEGEVELERQKGEVIDLLNQMAGVRNRLTALSSDRENNRRTRERLAAEEEKVRMAVNENEARQGSVAKEKAYLENLLARWKEEEAQKREEEKRALEDSTLLADRLNLLKVKREAQMSRLKVLEEMERGYEGYQKGPRTVLAAAARGERKLEGVLGPVAAAIRLQATYERAMEAALGGAQQFIITQDEGAARRAIEFLKKVDGGRATFLPLDTVTSHPLSREEGERIRRAGAIGIALELVQYEERYRPALAHLLERVVVAPDLETALQVGRATGFRFKVVTLEGDLLNPGGSLTGGSRETRTAGFLGRRREREELEQEVVALALSLEEQRRGLGQRQAERKTLEESLQVLQTEIRTAELRMVGLEQEGAALHQARERMLQDLDYLKAAQEELRREDRQKGDEIQAEEAVLAGLMGEETRLKTSLEGQQEGLKEEIRRRELLQERLTELKVEVARSRQEEAGLASNLEALNKRLEELRKEGREKERELREVQSRRQELELARQHYQEEKDKWEKARLAGDTELRSREEQREVLVREMNRLEREIKAQRRGLEMEKEALQTSEVQAARLEVARDGLGEKLRALGVEPGAVTSGRKRRWEAAERERLQQEIQDLAAKIEALGPVSLGAIEEYRELSQRLHFLKHQQLDLEKSREALLRLVEEMDREMKRLFAETFATVRVYFRQIFQELFGGGTADLKLEDPENLLETGVEVVAQPPGKKLQSLSLLSGGEKALASIALLFALLRTRPSAFLVLDEIEASLDEANVERFAAYIRGLAEKIQFILITHQRKTMETARALYGISMEEMGVSRLVSLRLVAKTG